MASKNPPKKALTEIRTYGLVSYMSHPNSDQGRLAEQAGARAGAGATGNRSPSLCGPSSASHASFMSHPHPPANLESSLKNPAKLPFRSLSNEGR